MARRNTTFEQRVWACDRVKAGEPLAVVATSFGVQPATVQQWLTHVPRQLAYRQWREMSALWPELAKWVDVDVRSLIKTPKDLLGLCAVLEKHITEARAAMAATSSGAVADGVVSLAEYRARRFGVRTDGGAA